ncbi:MAG TPA: prepilin-type N-terminal cleavage/methylation domain-containing protein [Gammaproteobacteria bacterium]|nr:prepilin-type N-terminal cleavage/methylation domain-containing protein [Gammaproteobacteria bacterium]
MSIPKKQTGFTLVELSMVLVVIGLILGTAITALTSFLARAQFSETRAQLALVQEALIGYAISKGRLPCPDVNDYPPTAPTMGSASDGVGDMTGTSPGDTCVREYGYLPYAELGLPPRDIWGTYYQYRVDDVYADIPPAGQTVTFSLTETEGEIDVKDSAASANPIADNIVALVFSAGPNAHVSVPAVSADEDENLNNDRIYVDKDYVPAGASTPEFDDILNWISSYTLKAKMTKAQRLPE